MIKLHWTACNANRDGFALKSHPDIVTIGWGDGSSRFYLKICQVLALLAATLSQTLRSGRICEIGGNSMSINEGKASLKEPAITGIVALIEAVQNLLD